MVTGAPEGRRNPACWGGSGRGVDPRTGSGCGGPGLLALSLRKRSPTAACHPGQTESGRRRRHEARRQVNLSTSQPRTQVPAQRSDLGVVGPKPRVRRGAAQRGVAGCGGLRWVRAPPARGATRISPRLHPASPRGLTHALSQGARILQTGPGRREAAGERKATRFPQAPRGPQEATCLSPAAAATAGSEEGSLVWRLPRAPGWLQGVPRCPPSARPGASPPRPRRAGTSEPPGPQEPRGRGPSVPPRPSPDVSVSRRPGKGAGERRERPFLRRLPAAGIAA